jgi:hypothetical protein
MNLRLGFRSILAALILSLGGSVPLSAQLNPQLQGSPTDFLDLYQQSSQTKVKPEIMTVFDFSGSMQNLMFHPQYVNTDATDSGNESQITFTLNAGVAGNNVYTVTATSVYDNSVYATVQLTVGSGGTVTSSNFTNTYAYTTEPCGHTSNSVRTSCTGITVTGSSGTLTLSTKIYIYNTSTSSSKTANDGINWTVSPTVTPTPFGTPSTSDSQTLAKNGGQHNYTSTTTFVSPAYNAGTPAYVSASFSAYQGGSAFSGATLVCLVKPDGTAVTATDAGTAANPTGLTPYGISSGASDVRNWVRAASHARFSYNDSGTTRTVDVPIPWKITNRNVAIQNPLPSQTVLDQEVKVASNGTTTTYGSGQQVEMDLMYTFDNGSDVLSGNSSLTTTTNLSLVVYKNAYLTWLFTGKYQSSNSANAYYSVADSGKYIVFDAATGNLAAGQGTGNLAWGQGYGTFAATDTIQMPQYSLSGVWQSDATVSASLNAVPALMRCQAVKRAAIQTWIQYQADVLWAFRFLDPSHEANGGSATTIDNNSQTTLTNAAGKITSKGYGQDSAWTLMNNTAAQGTTSTSGNSVIGMQRIAALFPNSDTPLTYAMARGLAQFTDPNSVFNTPETTNGASTTSQCLSHFLIVFTDGIDNNGSGTNNTNGTTPYVTKTGSAYVFNADTGNKAILGSSNYSVVNRNGADWNMFTFSAMAAHMSDSTLGGQVAGTDYLAAWDPGSPGAAQKSGTPSTFIPFAIKRRNGTLFNHDHPITTMTVGVSLGGTTAPPATGSISPKWNLLLAAALGDPTVDSYPDVTQLTPFQWDPSLNSGTGGRVSGSIYYFDGTNPDALSQDLNYAFQSAVNASQINVTSNPNLPFIGSSLGEEILLGKFQPPQNGGVMWSGDLLMFPTTTDANGNTVILDKTGNPTSTLNSTTAVWSGYNALLDNRRWDARNLYTRLPGADPTVATLTPFTYTGTTTSNLLLNYVAQDNPTNYPAGGTNQQSLIKFIMGANLLDPTDSTPSLANRANIMGDIIDSAPAYLTYTFSDITLPTGSKLSLAGRNRFRLILVGTNQGWLEAFGETTQVNSVQPNPISQPNTYVNLVTGEVDELWAFMPTDFLKYLDYLNTSTNSHKFMVDGTPDIYFLDLPSSTGGSGNGTYDGSNVAINPLTDTTHERGIALIGLREGGRSYYALNLHNPFVPTLQWSLVPDEASSIPQSRNLTGLSLASLQAIVANMGFSTCTPSIGRVLFNGVYKDVVFLGGGYSVPQVEANFTGAPKLGRSVLAIDVYSGNILAAVDLTSSSIGGTSVGPIANGLVPFEYFLGSGMAQRAYFLDMWGSLWCWGSKNTVSSSSTSNPGYRNFRLDTSELQAWSSDGTQSVPYGGTGIRKVYHDANSTVASGLLSGPAYTTLPSPFLVGTFTGAGHTDSLGTTAIPTAVGIAMESGNRYDPLDFGTNLPANTRLTVVFDRQDSRAWSFDSASGPDTGINADSYLLNAGKWGPNGGISTTLASGAASITPGTPSYYLAPSSQGSTDFGYYVTFPDKIQDTTNTSVYHYSKGINPPMVVSGSLYYSYFTPTTADVCTGGSGYTYSNKICDVINPVVSVPTPTGMICGSGWVGTWLNVASDFSMLGSVSVQQAGTIATANPANPNQTITTMSSATYSGQGQSRFPKARVWRTVH